MKKMTFTPHNKIPENDQIPRDSMRNVQKSDRGTAGRKMSTLFCQAPENRLRIARTEIFDSTLLHVRTQGGTPVLSL